MKKIAVFTGIVSIGLLSLNLPALSQQACVLTDIGQKVCGRLLPSNSSVPLQGSYSLTWAAQPGTQCFPGSIQQLTISPDGFMQGVYSGNQTVTYSGKVDADGTWSGALSNFGLSFKGTIREGKLMGTYIQKYGSLSCQGVAEGYKIPDRPR